jgi:phenylalanyl-tRNA synthetase beta chain
LGKEWNHTLMDFSRIVGFTYETESFEDKEEIKIELNPDRPDLYSWESIHEALNMYRNGKLLRGTINKSDTQIENCHPESRPFFSFFTVKNLQNTHQGYFLIRDFLEFSDKICDTVGKQRKKFAVGVHDLESIGGSISSRKANILEEFKTYDNKSGKIRDLLATHEKGIKYQSLRNYDEIVAVSDNSGPISIPPFFNSFRTRITEQTSQLMIDITATTENGLMEGLRLMAGYFITKGISIEVSAKGESFQIYKKILNLINNTIEIKPASFKKISGIEQPNKEVLSKNLNSMGYTLNRNKVNVPLNRIDVMGERDVIEDVIKIIGIKNIKEKPLKSLFIGKANKINNLCLQINDLVISQGFQEVKNFVVREKNAQADYFKILNPKSRDFSVIRSDLFIGLLSFVSRNKSQGYPQKIFEIGDVVCDETQVTKLGILSVGPNSSYSEIKGTLDSITNALNMEVNEIDKVNHWGLINGRSGRVILKSQEHLGIIGELTPQILIENGIIFPASYLEIDICLISK